HLGSTSARRGLTIGEGAPVGTIGPSGEVEHDVPYVHLGIRRSEDPNGYVDPLRFLPVQPVEPAAPSPAATAAAAPAPPPTASAPTPAPERQRRSVPAWFWWAALLPVAGAMAVVVRRRRRDSGSREPAPIIAANVALLPDNADLLRELEPTHRACVHDHRRRHPRAASSPARRRDLLPDRDGRERFEERARARGS